VCRIECPVPGVLCRGTSALKISDKFLAQCGADKITNSIFTQPLSLCKTNKALSLSLGAFHRDHRPECGEPTALRPPTCVTLQVVGRCAPQMSVAEVRVGSMRCENKQHHRNSITLLKYPGYWS